jgi:hypothetical protein
MKVNISPGVGIIKIFKALDYESWYALAEYIDNSISSYLFHKEYLRETNSNFVLEVNIEINHIDERISISDNAGGISCEKYEYAFRAAEIPDDNTGLNEFGMGMKTASSWLANKWIVITKALEESVERTIEFNVNDVVLNNTQELKATERQVSKEQHYTKIILEELTGNAPIERDVKKIKKHLSSIHRKFIENEGVIIRVNGERLIYERPEVLKAPKWDNELGEKIVWKIPIDTSFGNKKRVKGFVALLSTMSTSVHNGFSLFRRGRVIEGSGDDLYRPKQLCGHVGSPQFKRVFGELELEGFKVDFTKGKFQGDRDFEELLDIIQDYCDSDNFPLLRQGNKYRKPQPKEDLKKVATRGVKDYKDSVLKKEFKNSIESIAIQNKNIEVKEKVAVEVIPEKNKLEQITEEYIFEGEKYIFELNLVDSELVTDWIEILESTDVEVGVTKVKIRLSLIHPLMSSFGSEDLQPFIRLAISFALAEVLARMSGGGPGSVRRNLNKVLNTVISR